MRRTAFLLALGVATWLALPTLAGASGGNSECRLRAKADFVGCKDECKAAFEDQKAVCRNADPACFRACRAGRESCSEPYLATLDACLDVCNADFDGNKAACGPKPADDADPAVKAAWDACVDAAQLTRYACKDTCRENPMVREGLKSCRRGFHACVKTCLLPS